MLKLKINLLAERLGVSFCNDDSVSISRLLSMVDSATLSSDDIQFVRDVFDEISECDTEFYKYDSIESIAVADDGGKKVYGTRSASPIAIHETNPVINDPGESEYAVVSYFRWPGNVIYADVESETFDIARLSVNACKVDFLESMYFTDIQYDDATLDFDTSAGRSDEYHLRLYTRTSDGWRMLKDFDFSTFE